MAARIYADVKGNKCACGGSFSKRLPHPDEPTIRVPKCDQCESYPPLFVIDADSKDIDGNNKKVRIRNDQNNSRLDKISKVIFTLERIQQELMDGTFDIRKYDSELSKEAFKFSNYAAHYLKKQDDRVKREEITPKGRDMKAWIINKELVPHFKDLDISKINEVRINQFKESYTRKLRTRDLALGDLRAILKEAYKEAMIARIPLFDSIPKANEIEDTISLELAIETIMLIPREIIRDMFLLRTIFPIRPAEVCAITRDQIDRFKRKFKVDKSFSSGVLLSGRKSMRNGRHPVLTYDYGEEAARIFDKYLDSRVVTLNPESRFLFLNGVGKPFDPDYLSNYWRDARKILGHSYSAYQCKHARLSDLSDKMNGNLVKLKRASGHTNTATLERYVRNRDDMRELF